MPGASEEEKCGTRAEKSWFRNGREKATQGCLWMGVRK